MTGGEGQTPPSSDGEFLLRLLKNPPQYPSQPKQSQLLNHDPAVAEIGPSTPILFHPNSQRNGLHPSWMQHQYHHSPSPSPSPRPLPPSAPHNYFMQNRNTNLGSDPGSTFNYDAFGNDVRNLGQPRANIRATGNYQQEQKGFAFGSYRDKNGSMTGFLPEDPSISRQDHMRMEGNRGYNGVEVGFQPNSADFDRDKRSNLVDSRVHEHEGSTYINGARHWDGKRQKELYSGVDSRVHVQEGRNYSSGDTGWGRKGHKELYSRGTTAMPGINVQQDSEYTSRRGFEQNGERGRINYGNSRYQSGKSERVQYMNAGMMDNKLDYRRFSPVSTSSSVSASSALELSRRDTKNRETRGNGTWETTVSRDDGKGDNRDIDLDNLTEQLADVLDLGDEVDEKTEKRKHHKSHDKEYRSDKRGASIMGQRTRHMRSQVPCRVDIERWNIPFLAIYESLIPAEEEKVKQKQLMGLLENVVSKEWPGARLYLYGSCANSFGFSKSDLDVCLTVDDADIQKSAVLLKLADLLQSENLLNVQALTRARVPIVKLMDPKTGISCDICVNNVLAVVNTKLLRDYAEVDVRLRQLAFMVKHWAKSRAVNETYQGTLSSYAYVLMCIHFLQLRRPAILPCLQEMPATYSVVVNNVECAFFDHVEKLAGHGSQNGESISQLLWSFFHYWAYCHDYANDVISVRTGCILSKRFKDWTRRIGNDRHLICIEDPFEVSHDLGRVVDKKSIKVLREEFERAADIMQHDPNPCVTLFEPYVPT